MKLEYTESIPPWLRGKAKEMISRRVDLDNKYVHITQLLQPAPLLAMTAHYWNELTQDPGDLIPAMMGTAWHTYLEGSMAGGIAEQRIEVQHGDWTVIGTPDWWDQTRIVDFKTTRVWSRIFGKREWEEQLNLYRFLIWVATGNEIDRLEIHAVYTDWTANGAKSREGHPPKRWEVIDIPAWGMEDTRNFLDARIRAIEAAKLTDVCSAEERWERGEHWALMKHGRKTAIKRYDTEDEALTACTDAQGDPIAAYYVEHRPGVPARCNDWCSVKEFCSFGKKLEEVA